MTTQSTALFAGDITTAAKESIGARHKFIDFYVRGVCHDSRRTIEMASRMMDRRPSMIAMDLPDADTNRDRGLPLDEDHPSVRLLRPSVPFNDPGHRGSLDAPVTSKTVTGQCLPASPGNDKEAGGDVDAPGPPPQYDCI